MKPLKRTDDEDTTTIDYKLIRKLERQSALQQGADIYDSHEQVKPKTASLRLLLPERANPLEFRRITGPITLGRTHEETCTYPTVDLTPDHGHELGVSRIHAQIELIYDNYYIKDLSSTNGTWVNGRRVQPNELVAITSGDQLRLGRLMILLS